MTSMNAPPGIKETSEVLVAVGRIWYDVRRAYKDGKMTKLEAMHIGFGNIAEVVAALSGISEVGKELADLTPDEMDELYRAFMEGMQWEERTTSRDTFNIFYNWVRFTLQQWQALQNTLRPPRAVVIPEDL